MAVETQRPGGHHRVEQSPPVDDPDPGPHLTEWIGAEYAYDAEGPHAVTSVTRPTSTDTYLYEANPLTGTGGNPSTPFRAQAGSGQRMTCRIEDGLTFKQTYIIPEVKRRGQRRIVPAGGESHRQHGKDEREL